MLIKTFYHILVHYIPAIDNIPITGNAAEALLQWHILKLLEIQQRIAGTLLHGCLQCLIIDFAALGEDILGASSQTISMKVMGLEKLCPEFGFRHFGRYILHVLALNGGICFKNAVDDVRGKIVFEAIAAVGLRLDVSQECARHTYKSIEMYYSTCIGNLSRATHQFPGSCPFS